MLPVLFSKKSGVFLKVHTTHDILFCSYDHAEQRPVPWCWRRSSRFCSLKRQSRVRTPLWRQSAGWVRHCCWCPERCCGCQRGWWTAGRLQEPHRYAGRSAAPVPWDRRSSDPAAGGNTGDCSRRCFRHSRWCLNTQTQRDVADPQTDADLTVIYWGCFRPSG